MSEHSDAARLQILEEFLAAFLARARARRDTAGLADQAARVLHRLHRLDAQPGLDQDAYLELARGHIAAFERWTHANKSRPDQRQLYQARRDFEFAKACLKAFAKYAAAPTAAELTVCLQSLWKDGLRQSRLLTGKELAEVQARRGADPMAMRLVYLAYQGRRLVRGQTPVKVRDDFRRAVMRVKLHRFPYL